MGETQRRSQIGVWQSQCSQPRRSDSQEMPYFSPCLQNVQLAPQATSAHLPGCRSCSAPTVSRGPVFCLTLTHKHTENKSNQEGQDATGFTVASLCDRPASCHRQVKLVDLLTFRPVRFFIRVSSTSPSPSTSISTQSPSPPAFRLRRVTLNYLSLPNKRIAVTKHCKLDRIMRRRWGNRWFLCCHLMREPESAQPPLHSEWQRLVVSHPAATNVSLTLDLSQVVALRQKQFYCVLLSLFLRISATFWWKLDPSL